MRVGTWRVQQHTNDESGIAKMTGWSEHGCVKVLDLNTIRSIVKDD